MYLIGISQVVWSIIGKFFCGLYCSVFKHYYCYYSHIIIKHTIILYSFKFVIRVVSMSSFHILRKSKQNKILRKQRINNIFQLLVVIYHIFFFLQKKNWETTKIDSFVVVEHKWHGEYLHAYECFLWKKNNSNKLK